jgi:hypothetical protein
LLSSVNRFSNRPFASGNEVDEYQDNGNHQQDVNEPSHGVTAYETEQPQGEQYYRNCVQHIISLPVGLLAGTLPRQPA